jgi:hypothetical protein
MLRLKESAVFRTLISKFTKMDILASPCQSDRLIAGNLTTTEVIFMTFYIENFTKISRLIPVLLKMAEDNEQFTRVSLWISAPIFVIICVSSLNIYQREKYTVQENETFYIQYTLPISVTLFGIIEQRRGEILSVVLSNETNRVGVSDPFTWGRKQIQFSNCCVPYCVLKYLKMDKVQKPRNSQCNTPPSEPFRI